MANFSLLNRYSPKAIGIASIFVIIFSIILGFYAVPKIIESNVNKMNLKPGSDKRKLWEKTPFPLTFKIYLFNLTNPLEVVQGMTPKVQEIGPYVFHEYKHKENIVDHEEEDAVSFDMMNTFHFRPELTNGSPDDIVVIPHVFLMGGLISTKRDRAGFLSIVVNAFRQIFQPEESPFLTTKVMDILFNGIGIDCNREELEASLVCPNLANEKQLKMINSTYYTVSLFGGKNSSSLGRFKVNRGIKDIMKVGQVISFNDKSESKTYKGSCNVINGTDGTIFPPYRQKSEKINSFSPAFCRTMGMTYVRDGSYNSVPTSVFTINFNDLKSDSSQHCFCRSQNQELCPPKGVFDMYPCTGAPLMTSKPHFLEADPSLLKQVEGLKPDKQKHELKLEFEMITGSPVSVANRIQFSMDVEPIEEFDLMANMKKSLIPIFWIEETLNLDKKITNKIRYGLYWTQTGSTIIKYSGMILGVLGMIYTAYKIFMQESSASKTNSTPPIIQTIQPSSLSTTKDTKY